MSIEDDYIRKYSEYKRSQDVYDDLSKLGRFMMKLKGTSHGFYYTDHGLEYGKVKYVANEPDFDKVGSRRAIQYGDLGLTIKRECSTFHPITGDEVTYFQPLGIPAGKNINDLWTVVEYIGGFQYRDLITGEVYTLNFSNRRLIKTADGSNKRGVCLLRIFEYRDVAELTPEIKKKIMEETLPKKDEVIAAINAKRAFALDAISKRTPELIKDAFLPEEMKQAHEEVITQRINEEKERRAKEEAERKAREEREKAMEESERKAKKEQEDRINKQINDEFEELFSDTREHTRKR